MQQYNDISLNDKASRDHRIRWYHQFLSGRIVIVVKMDHNQNLEMRGIEPRAFHMQSERSTTELHPLPLTVEAT